MIIKSYIHGKYEKTNTTTSDNSNDKRYFKLPYIGKFSTLTKNKVKCLVEKYCKDIDVSLVFTSYKIKDSFSTKDYVPKALKSGIVYQFVCASCKACYVGETTRHYSTRIKEHLEKDSNSHVYKHINNSPDCRNLSNEDCFSILDHGETEWQLKIKEGLHITWKKQNLNKQIQHLTISMSV